jgi:excisionase family DNA binding protein
MEMTVAEAAVSLGCSPDTVRRRIRAGQMQARTDEHGRYLVQMPDPEPVPEAPARQDDEAERLRVELAHTRELLGELRARTDGQEREIARMAGQLDAAETERSELRRLLGNAQMQLGEAQQQITRLLPAPRADAGSEGAASSRTDQAATSTAVDEARGMHTLAHQLERKKPWWWLPGWRKQRGR